MSRETKRVAFDGRTPAEDTPKSPARSKSNLKKSPTGGLSPAGKAKKNAAAANALSKAVDEPDADEQRLNVETGIALMRQALVAACGSEAEVIRYLDEDGDDEITLSELKHGLEGLHISLEELTGGKTTVKTIFETLDIDGSGNLSLTELLDASPYAAEEEGVHRLRQVLLDRFKDYAGVIKALDADGDGQISLKELETTIVKMGISEEEATGGTSLARVFDILDIDLSGDLTIEELLTGDPREAARQRDEAIKRFRKCLLGRFKTQQGIVEAFDTSGTGKLCLMELEHGRARFQIPVRELCGSGHDLRWLFKILDRSGTGDLDIRELMTLDPVAEAKRRAAARKAREERLEAAKKKNLFTVKSAAKALKALATKRKKSVIDVQMMQMQMKLVPGKFTPDASPRSPRRLSPSLAKIEEFAEDEDCKILDLKQACLGEKGADRLAWAIANPGVLRNMEFMDLSGNYMGPFGTQQVIGCLERHCRLQSLSLAWNSIDDTAMERICKCLSRIPCLVDVDLSYNRFKESGAKELAKGLHTAPQLQKLDVRGNNFGRMQSLVSITAAKAEGAAAKEKDNNRESAEDKQQDARPTKKTGKQISVRDGISEGTLRSYGLTLLVDADDKMPHKPIYDNKYWHSPTPVWKCDAGHTPKHGLSAAGDSINLTEAFGTWSFASSGVDVFGLQEKGRPASAMASAMSQELPKAAATNANLQRPQSVPARKSFRRTRTPKPAMDFATPAWLTDIEDDNVPSPKPSKSTVALITNLDRFPVNLPASAWPAAAQLAKSVSDAALRRVKKRK
eukprot:TRINITY_DN9669_c0_g1_i2.p1 TRINITY_DN9669_c0_g1~~TRINITY_DN9669_c0_g1_i2.p1  ORF type:complete len:818 (-),score=204.71 TRINITY_DN9669_c0_g1_i2:293-2680(-)